MSEIKLPKLQKVDSNKVKKKKILLLADDLRMSSGVATMSAEIKGQGTIPYGEAKEVQVPTKLTTMTVRGMGAAIKGGNYHGCS